MPNESLQISNQNPVVQDQIDRLDQRTETNSPLQTGLKAPVEGKEGTLKLIKPSTGSKQETALEKKSRFNFGRGEDEATFRSNLLRDHFNESLQGCNPEDTEKLLWDLENYLQNVNSGRTPTTDLDSLITRRQELQARRSAAGPSSSVSESNPSSPRQADKATGSSATFYWHEDLAPQSSAPPKNPPAAMDVLTRLHEQVKGKRGVLKLTNAGAPDPQFKLTSWHQILDRRDSAMKATSNDLKRLFRDALAGCPEVDKALLLGDIDTYLEGRNNKFGTKSFEAFFGRLEALKNPAGIGEQQPAAPKTYGTQLTQEEDYPWHDGSPQNRSILSEDSQRTSYLVKVPISPSNSTPHLERVVTVENNPLLHPVKNQDAIKDLMRTGDFAASQFKNEKNVLRAEEYYITLQENPEIRTSWRVGAHELENFIQQKVQENPDVQIGVYATVTRHAKGKALSDVSGDGFFSFLSKSQSQSVTGVTQQVARGTYEAMTSLHKSGLAHNDLKRDNIVYNEKTGGVTVTTSRLMHQYSTSGDKNEARLKLSNLSEGTPGYMSPRVAQGAQHGLETDYYSFACLLLTTTEPDFERVLSGIHAREYPGEKRAVGENILKDKFPEDYLKVMIEQAKGNSQTREAGERLEEKLKKNPDFEKAVMDSFIASSSHDGQKAYQARQTLTENPYLQYPS